MLNCSKIIKPSVFKIMQFKLKPEQCYHETKTVLPWNSGAKNGV